MTRRNDPAAGLARGFLRAVGDERAVEEFDEAVEKYGLSEALAEVGLGMLVGGAINDRRRLDGEAADPKPPLVHEGPVAIATEADDWRATQVLTIDVPHDECEVLPADGALIVRKPSGPFEHPVPYPDALAGVEIESEPGDGTTRAVVTYRDQEAE